MQEDTYSGQADDLLNLNLYLYCFNNPIKYDDPTGHEVKYDPINGRVQTPDPVTKTTQKITVSYDAAKGRNETTVTTSTSTVKIGAKTTIATSTVTTASSSMAPTVAKSTTTVATTAPVVTYDSIKGRAQGTTTTTVVVASSATTQGGSKTVSTTQGAGNSTSASSTKTGSNIGKYLYTGGEIVCGVITVAASGVTIVATDGLASPLAYAAAVHGVNSVLDGIRDINHIRNGEIDKVGTENYLRDNVYVPAAKTAGNAVGSTIDAGVKLTTGKDTNYSSTGSKIGENVGYVGYYAVDTISGYQSVKESVSILKDVPKLQSLPSTYYDAGNILDGYTRMNNLSIWTEGSSSASKGYAALSGAVNAGSMYFNANDLKGKYGN